jgi:hypothetical protein
MPDVFFRKRTSGRIFQKPRREKSQENQVYRDFSFILWFSNLNFFHKTQVHKYLLLRVLISNMKRVAEAGVQGAQEATRIQKLSLSLYESHIAAIFFTSKK